MNTTTQVAEQAAVESVRRRPRFEFLDGLRGLAALYVVLFHARYVVFHDGSRYAAPAWLYYATAWMQPGLFAVGAFIILSGFCLMLPVAASPDGQLRGGALGYLKRRARRIIPPYYAACLLSLLIIAAVPAMRTPRRAWWDQSLPAFRADVLLSHLALVHNLSVDWYTRINGALWSVGTEWQIYFLFPLILLPVWRRAGLWALVVAGFMVGCLPVVLRAPLYEARPWYVGFFALGMAGAALSTARSPGLAGVRDRVPWGALAIVPLVLFLLDAIPGLAHHTSWIWDHRRTDDVLLALAAFCALVCCASAMHAGRRPRILRVLSSRVLVGLGAFSYSLYLTHVPVLGVLELLAQSAGLSAAATLALTTLVGVPLSLGAAYLFFLAVERHFIPGHLRPGPG